jgi:hypothetical protein
MKAVRVLSRLALLSLAAAAFVGLTDIYGRSVRLPLRDPHDREVRGHRPSAPEASQFPEFLAEVITLAIYAVAGRVVFRLRLSPVSLSNRQPIVLNLHDSKAAKA